MSVPNQKTIFIERSTDSVKKDFLKVSNASLNMAMSNLKPTSFYKLVKNYQEGK